MKREEWVSLLESQKTIWPSVYPRNPFTGPYDTCFINFLMSLYLATFLYSVSDP